MRTCYLGSFLATTHPQKVERFHYPCRKAGPGLSDLQQLCGCSEGGPVKEPGRHQLATIGPVENSPLKKKKVISLKLYQRGKSITLISGLRRIGCRPPGLWLVKCFCPLPLIKSLPSYCTKGLECFANQSEFDVLKRSKRREMALFVLALSS